MQLTSGNEKAVNAADIPFNCEKSRAAWVVFQLRMKGKSLAGLAKEHGLSRSIGSYALQRPYPRVEKIIADELGIAQEDLFPERYCGGARIDRRRKDHA